jgi:hypothetical protein
MQETVRQTIDDRRVRRDDFDRNSIGEKTLNRTAWIAGLMLLGFLFGFVPSWLFAVGYEHERDGIQRTARVSAIRHQLASATLNARAGRYEEARLHASHFFTKLRSEFDRDDTVFKSQEKGRIQEILARRDEIITMLARKDSAAADMMAQWYLESDRFGKVS